MTSHYQQQLAQQLRAAEDELGQRCQQVAELTEQRDTTQARAEQAEARIAAARALHAADRSNPLGPWCPTCSCNWPCQTARALDGTEAAHICEPGSTEYFCPTSGETESSCHGGFDACCDAPELHRPVPAPAGEPSVALRSIGYWRPLCPACQQLPHPGVDCNGAVERMAVFEETMAAVMTRFDRESSRHLGAAFTCDHRDPKKLGHRLGSGLALFCQCGAQVSPGLRQSTASEASDSFRVKTTDPVEEVAAEPATLARLKSRYFTVPADRGGFGAGQIGAFFGFPLVLDTGLPPGEVHLRPRVRVAACGSDCDGGHVYDGHCLVDPHLAGIIGRSTDPEHPGWYWSCEGDEAACEGWLSLDHASAAAARRSFDRHVARDHRVAAAAPLAEITSPAHWTDPLTAATGSELYVAPLRDRALPTTAGRQFDCPACQFRAEIPHPYLCPGHPTGQLTPEEVAAILHSWQLHPGWEYATTTGPRKAWDMPDVPPDPSWEPNPSAGSQNGWERFDYHEEAYWRRPKAEARP